LCASRVSAYPVSGFRPVVHRLKCTSLLPVVAGQLVSAYLRLSGDRFSLKSGWLSIDPASGQQCPDHSGNLVGERDRHAFGVMPTAELDQDEVTVIHEYDPWSPAH